MSKFTVERYVVSIVHRDSGETRVAKTKIPCCCCASVLDLIKRALPYLTIGLVMWRLCKVLERF